MTYIDGGITLTLYHSFYELLLLFLMDAVRFDLKFPFSSLKYSAPGLTVNSVQMSAPPKHKREKPSAESSVSFVPGNQDNTVLPRLRDVENKLDRLIASVERLQQAPTYVRPNLRSSPFGVPQGGIDDVTPLAATCRLEHPCCVSGDHGDRQQMPRGMHR